MGILILILCIGCFTPLMVGMARHILHFPERISTPTWLLVTNALFILGGPVVYWTLYGEDLTNSVRGAATIAGVIVACTLAWTLVEVWVFSRTKVLYVDPGSGT